MHTPARCMSWISRAPLHLFLKISLVSASSTRAAESVRYPYRLLLSSPNDRLCSAAACCLTSLMLLLAYMHNMDFFTPKMTK